MKYLLSGLRMVSFLVLLAPSASAQGVVIPLVECLDSFEVSVNQQNPSVPPRRQLTIATFGYFNVLNQAVTIPVGADNFLFPGSVNRGQPTTFTGYVPLAFQAAGGDGRDILWVVDAQQTVARPGLKTCSALPTVPFLIPIPLRLIAGTAVYGVELMKLLSVLPGASPSTQFSVQAQVAEATWSSGAGMRAEATSSIAVSNVRLTDTAVVGDVSVVASPSRTSYPLSVQLLQNGTLKATKSMPIEVYNACPLSITPNALPAATVNMLYPPVSLGAIGGTAPYTFELASGALPPGMILADGIVSGTPTTAGTFVFTLNGMSSDRCLATQSYTLVVGGPACALDVTGNVSITLGGFRQNLITGRWQQTVALRNNGSTAILAPVSLALQGLSTNAALFNGSGVTQCAAPAGRPYLRLNLNGTWLPGQTITATLEFTNTTPGQAITYTPRVLAGGVSL